jgi:hypothetical protein
MWGYSVLKLTRHPNRRFWFRVGQEGFWIEGLTLVTLSDRFWFQIEQKICFNFDFGIGLAKRGGSGQGSYSRTCHVTFRYA